jgi:hypothetical protein
VSKVLYQDRISEFNSLSPIMQITSQEDKETLRRLSGTRNPGWIRRSKNKRTDVPRLSSRSHGNTLNVTPRRKRKAVRKTRGL